MVGVMNIQRLRNWLAYLWANVEYLLDVYVDKLCTLAGFAILLLQILLYSILLNMLLKVLSFI